MAFNPVWANSIEIGTTNTGGTWSYSKLCKGIENVTFNSNEQNQQYFFLCGEGVAHNEVTGSAPELQVSGRRIAGDAAQDYIVGLQFALGDDRNSSIKITADHKEYGNDFFSIPNRFPLHICKSSGVCTLAVRCLSALTRNPPVPQAKSATFSLR